MSTAVSAQDTLDFIDPLNDERSRIEQGDGAPPASTDRERTAPRTPAFGAVAPPSRDESAALLARARDGASASAAAAQDRATGMWGKMRATLSSIAAAFGLSTLALVALLLLLLLGLAWLIGWTLFRGRRQKYTGRRTRIADQDSDLYADTPQDLKRRRAEDERAGDYASAESHYAKSEQDDGFTETMPNDFDAIFAEENRGINPVQNTPAEIPRDSALTTPRSADPAPAPKSATADEAARDTSTWRKPNLDRLRESIKADWTASKKRPAKAAKAMPAPSQEPADRRLGDITDGWEEWDEQISEQDDPWGKIQQETAAPQADDDALRRIRALRKSLQTS